MLVSREEGEIFLVQVKSKSKAALLSSTKRQYRYIDIFVGQSKDLNGINLYYREDEFKERFFGKDVLKSNLEYLKIRYK